MIALTWPQVLAFRMTRHHLIRRAPRTRLTRVVGDVCGIQAQVMSAAELAIWARVENVTREEIRAALWERRTVVKTWCMRGTLHLLPTAEYPTYIGALRERTGHRRPSWLRYFGLTLDEIEALIEQVPAILDGRTLTREDLASALGRRFGPHLRQKLLGGWGSLLKPVAYRGYLCFGPSRGQNVTFVRPDQWLGVSLADAPDEIDALTALARRYLAAYGPATYPDFGLWWGGAAGQTVARKAWRALGNEIVEVNVEGEPAWMLAADAKRAQNMKPAETVRLLPNFDGYVFNYTPREHLVPARFSARVFRAQGWISPVLLINGIAAGTWGSTKSGTYLEVLLQPFAPLRPAFLKKAKEEADRLGRFLGSPVRVTA